MRKNLIKLSAKEGAAITKSAKSDPDSAPLRDKEWNKVKTSLTKGRGRPLGSGSKEQVTLRIDRETLAFYKSKGNGWQTLINLILGEIKKESHSIKFIEKRMSQGNLICSSSKIAL